MLEGNTYSNREGREEWIWDQEYILNFPKFNSRKTPLSKGSQSIIPVYKEIKCCPPAVFKVKLNTDAGLKIKPTVLSLFSETMEGKQRIPSWRSSHVLLMSILFKCWPIHAGIHVAMNSSFTFMGVETDSTRVFDLITSRKKDELEVSLMLIEIIIGMQIW